MNIINKCNPLGMPNSNVENGPISPLNTCVLGSQQEPVDCKELDQSQSEQPISYKFMKSPGAVKLPDWFVDEHLTISRCTDTFKNALRSTLLFQKHLSLLSFDHIKKYLEALKVCSSQAFQEDQKAITAAIYNNAQTTIKNRFSNADALSEHDKAILCNLFVEIGEHLRNK